MLGSVCMFDRERGFGFIKPHGEKKGRGSDVFFHVTSFERGDDGEFPMPVYGDEVEFDVGDSDKGNGQQAVNCELRRRGRAAD